MLRTAEARMQCSLPENNQLKYYLYQILTWPQLLYVAVDCDATVVGYVVAKLCAAPRQHTCCFYANAARTGGLCGCEPPGSPLHRAAPLQHLACVNHHGSASSRSFLLKLTYSQIETLWPGTEAAETCLQQRREVRFAAWPRLIPCCRPDAPEAGHCVQAHASCTCAACLHSVLFVSAAEGMCGGCVTLMLDCVHNLARPHPTAAIS